MATYLTSNTGNVKSTDRTAGGSKPDNTPATGTTTTGGGSGAVNSVTGSLGVGASPTTGNVSVYLNPTGVTAATYGDATHVPQIAVNAQGQITSANNVTITSSGVTSVSGTGTVQGISLSGTVTSTGNLTLGGSLSAVNLASQVSGVLPIANGGTNATSASVARTSLGAGTVNSVATSGSVNGITLTGGPITNTGTVTLGGTLSGIANSQLTNSSVTINTGTGLSGGGTVSLGGSLTLSNTTTGLPNGATTSQSLLYGTSTAGWYNQSYNVTAFANLSAAITAAGSTGVLYFPTAYTIPNATTINIPIIVEGLLTCTGTATFNGTIQAPLKQIFSGGTVSIGPNTPYIYPEWFGAAKTGSSNDQPSISAALSAVTLASGSGAPNQFVVLTGTYYLGSVLTLTNSQMFKVIGGASFYPYSTYTGDCIVYQYNSNNTVTDIPTIVGFTTGAGLTLLGCNVLKATGFMIKNCKYGIKIKAASGRTVLDNYVNVHFIPDCQYGVYVTDDGSGATIQGNEIYSNFYTNDNISSNPWVSGDYASGIVACYWDNLNNSGWNGNKIQIKAVDINGATSSYGFYNASTNATSSYLNNWDIDCSLWFGGINANNSASASFMTGRFAGCTARYCIQGNLGNIPWNSMSITGNTNRIIFLNGGGNWNVYPAAGQPAAAFAVSTTSSRSSFSSYAPYSNRLTCKYNITSSIAAGGLLQVYVYSPLTDAVTSGGVTGGSGNIYAVPYPNSTGGTPVGLVFEAAFDNSASVANEIVLFFRNCSGSTINSGTGFFDFIVTVGL
jgi:hypothetical protein